jgi:hypothetical protein
VDDCKRDLLKTIVRLDCLEEVEEVEDDFLLHKPVEQRIMGLTYLTEVRVIIYDVMERACEKYREGRRHVRRLKLSRDYP